ncbi:MAG: hypothetical protein OXI23_09080 [Gemmatimonadota bacterium]|nr:hypothetical protein [Gemmatimonadota bacterium]
MPELQMMLKGVCDVGRFLFLVRDFIVFEDGGSDALVKKMTCYCILRKHGYPRDKSDSASATLTVLRQAEVLSEGWATG